MKLDDCVSKTARKTLTTLKKKNPDAARMIKRVLATVYAHGAPRTFTSKQWAPHNQLALPALYKDVYDAWQSEINVALKQFDLRTDMLDELFDVSEHVIGDAEAKHIVPENTAPAATYAVLIELIPMLIAYTDEFKQYLNRPTTALRALRKMADPHSHIHRLLVMALAYRAIAQESEFEDDEEEST